MGTCRSILPFFLAIMALMGGRVRAAETGQEPGQETRTLDEALADPGFKLAVYSCVEGRKHPVSIILHVESKPGAGPLLLSVDPEPAPEVFKCIAAAVATLAPPAVGKKAAAEAVIALPGGYYPPEEGWGSLLPSAAVPSKTGPKPSSAVDKALAARLSAFPGGRDGGFGLYGSLVMVDWGVNDWDMIDEPDRHYVHKGRITGGFGLFFEFMPIPRLALGVELNVSFPELVVKGDYGEGCWDCGRDYLVRVLFRLKVPVRIAKNTSFYPLILLGYSDYLAGNIPRFSSHEAIDFHGLTFGAGAGIENHSVKYFSPFVEVRYMLHAGWYAHEEHLIYSGMTKQELVKHDLALNVGFRIP